MTRAGLWHCVDNGPMHIVLSHALPEGPNCKALLTRPEFPALPNLHKLFTPLAGQAQGTAGGHFYQVDEADLHRLGDAELCVLREHGWLRALYAHQVSLAAFGRPAAVALRTEEAFA